MLRRALLLRAMLRGKSPQIFAGLRLGIDRRAGIDPAEDRHAIAYGRGRRLVLAADDAAPGQRDDEHGGERRGEQAEVRSNGHGRVLYGHLAGGGAVLPPLASTN